jgi:uncharacterized protein
VMLMQTIRKSIADGMSPQDIFFVSIDTPLYGHLPLETLLFHFQKISGNSSFSGKLVIFDEIQYLKDWETHLKILTDKYPKIRFVASGSAAAALKLKSQESGAGRFTDFYLPPLTFAEFLMFRGSENKLIDAVPNSVPRRFVTSNIHGLNEEFVNYINFGGYPEAVLNVDVQNNIQRFLGRDIVDKVLLRDLPSLYGIDNIPELNRLYTMLAYQTGQELALDALAKKSNVAKNTLNKYLEYLEAAFLIVRVKRIDENGKNFQRTRSFKVYLTNPSMRAALFANVSEDDQAMGALAETAIFSQWFHSGSALRDLYYARWKKGRKELEIDLVKLDNARARPSWAYEIKWSNRFALEQPNELEGLIEYAKIHQSKGFKVGATTRTATATTTVDGIEVKHFPCALHCYQIGKNLAEGFPP